MLWDVGNKLTLNDYNVTDRPLFLAVGPDMIIRTRRSNEAGMKTAEREALNLLGE